MAMSDTVSFPNFDPVTGPPTIDGFTGDHDPGVTTTEIDPGYDKGDRISFNTGSGFPPVVFQGVRYVNPPGVAPGQYLALAFFCSFDVTWDDEDVIVVALRPQKTPPGPNPHLTERRIDIFPVHTGTGAGAPADAEVVLAGTPPGADFHVRRNKGPRSTSSWKRTGTTGAQWSSITPANLVARSTSWRPGTPDLAHAPGSGVTLTGATGFSFPVDSTALFPSTGVFIVDVTSGPTTTSRAIKYDGKTATSFENCEGGGSGSVAGGAGVKLSDVGWGIEVLVPTTIALGGADWIDLQDQFGIYFNICRFGESSLSGPSPHAGWYSTQFVFPLNGPFITGFLDDTTDIASGSYGTGLIPAMQTPPGSNLGLGVRFSNHTNPEFSIGVRDAAAASGTAPGDLVEGASGTHDNTLVAQIENTATGAGDTAQNVVAEFRVANWGLPAATFPAWGQASGSTPVPAGPATIPPGGSAEITASWPKANVPPQYATNNGHFCIWVRLDQQGAATPTNFVMSGVRRNIDFENLSEVEREAEVSGVGYPTPPGGLHEFLLFPHVRQIMVPKRDARVMTHEGAVTWEAVWVWTVEGLRKTGKTLTIGSAKAEVLDPTPGAFGIVAFHDDASHVLDHALSGGGIKKLRNGVYSLEVPDGGSVKIKAKLSAGPIPPGTDDPVDDGCLGWLFKIPIIGPILRAILEPILNKP